MHVFSFVAPLPTTDPLTTTDPTTTEPSETAHLVTMGTATTQSLPNTTSKLQNSSTTTDTVILSAISIEIIGTTTALAILVVGILFCLGSIIIVFVLLRRRRSQSNDINLNANYNGTSCNVGKKIRSYVCI